MAPSSGGPANKPRQQPENCAGLNRIGGDSSSTERWNDVPCGTMDEVSSYVRLDLLSVRRQARPKDCSASSSNPILEGPWCRFRREARACERHRHRGSGQSEKRLTSNGRLEKRASRPCMKLSLAFREADAGSSASAFSQKCRA